MSKSTENDESPITVQVTLTGKAALNFRNTTAASGRSYKQEATIRLEDHLENFESIGAIGQAFKR
ncbi:hypothetical protein OAA_13855 [Vibrio cyclitrophicus 1F175]|uniref:TraY domain-containing protein n=1 Tax=Vibrio TaxID=662 RepID=UPI0002E8ABA3|nr:TraY domain-containing protein [Vibrio cyclitrophicus]OEF63566.1 hypothetical protein OAA_13855 [Vibrio cyclitrophicus 1F175]